ncbi:hypothetical protein MAR_037556, partial [Mya arenaria]
MLDLLVILWLMWKWIIIFGKFLTRGGGPRKIHTGSSALGLRHVDKLPGNLDNYGKSGKSVNNAELQRNCHIAEKDTSHNGDKKSNKKQPVITKLPDVVNEVGCDKGNESGCHSEPLKVKNNGYLISQRLHDSKKQSQSGLSRRSISKSKSPSPAKQDVVRKRKQAPSERSDSSPEKEYDRFGTAKDETDGLHPEIYEHYKKHTHKPEKTSVVKKVNILENGRSNNVGGNLEAAAHDSEASVKCMKQNVTSVTRTDKYVSKCLESPCLQYNPCTDWNAKSCKESTKVASKTGITKSVVLEQSISKVTVSSADWSSESKPKASHNVKRYSEVLVKDIEQGALKEYKPNPDSNLSLDKDPLVLSTENVVKTCFSSADITEVRSASLSLFSGSKSIINKKEDLNERSSDTHDIENKLNEEEEDMAYRRSLSADSSMERHQFIPSLDRIRVYERYMEQQTRELISHHSQRRRSIDLDSSHAPSSEQYRIERYEPGYVFITKTSPKRMRYSSTIDVPHERRRNLSGDLEYRSRNVDSYSKYGSSSRQNLSEGMIKSKIREHMSSIIGKQLYAADKDVLYTYNLEHPINSNENKDIGHDDTVVSGSVKSDGIADQNEGQLDNEVDQFENYLADTEQDTTISTGSLFSKSEESFEQILAPKSDKSECEIFVSEFGKDQNQYILEKNDEQDKMASIQEGEMMVGYQNKVKTREPDSTDDELYIEGSIDESLDFGDLALGMFDFSFVKSTAVLESENPETDWNKFLSQEDSRKRIDEV